MFQVFDVLPSTNDYCLDYAKLHPDERMVCIAHRQTRGRGRHGKVWESEQTDNLYLSYLRPPVIQGPLSLVVGLVLAQLLEALGVQSIQLKWPNDILINGAKVAGILIEGPVIGMGLNIARPLADIDQNVTSLSEQGVFLDKLTLAHDFIHRLETAIAVFETSGFEAFKAEWARFDGLAGRSVTWENGLASGVSIALGLNEQGGLILADSPFVLTSGSVRLR